MTDLATLQILVCRPGTCTCHSRFFNKYTSCSQTSFLLAYWISNISRDHFLNDRHFDLYQELGRDNYGSAIAELASYFGTISPLLFELKPGFFVKSSLKTPTRFKNHLHTMHAIAICYSAEMVAGLTSDVPIPGGRRSIPVGMAVRYLSMANTDICDGKDIDWSKMDEINVLVKAENSTHEAMFQTDITRKISLV